MRRQPVLWIVIIVLALGAVLIFKKKSASSAAAAQAVASAKAAPLLELLPSDVAQVQSGPLQQVLQVSGSLRALEQVSVKAKVAGEVTQVLVREGETVQMGQVLATIEKGDYVARVEQSRGALKAAQGQLDIAANARNNNRKLHQQNFISQNALDNAESQYAIALANVETAKGALDVAQKSLQDTVVHAPMAGIVSARNVQPGEKVSPDARLLDVVDLRQLEMEISVPASEIASLAVGQSVKVEVEGVPQALDGKLARISPATQAGSRSILAYVKLDNDKGQLRAGMFGQARVILSSQNVIVKVPLSALYFDESDVTASATEQAAAAGRKEKAASVYVIDGGKLRRAAVTTGVQGEDAQGSVVEIKSGVQAGMQIIKTNLGNLVPGTQVKIAAARSAAAQAAPSASAASAAAAVPIAR